MTLEERKRLAERLKVVRELLEGIGTTSYAGVDANIKRALIAIDQALFNLGEED
jgi:Trp operon repressor